MSKAILVMDMPDRCDDCDLWDYDEETHLPYCGSWSGLGRLDDTSSKPDWCPLIDPANVGALIDALEGKHETD